MLKVNCCDLGLSPSISVSIRCKQKNSIRSSSTSTEKWRKTFEEQSKRKNISLNDWYQVDIKNLDEEASQIISQKFRGSMYKALSTIFPEHQWHPWKFTHHHVPAGYWTKTENLRTFFDDLGHKIGVNSMDDWYEKLSASVIANNGGTFLFKKQFNASPVAALMTAYPEHEWQLWKFNKTPHKYWDDVSTQRKFFDDLGQQLGVKNLDDWYEKLSVNVLRQHGGRALLVKYNDSPSAALAAVYPEHKWIPWKFNQVPTKFWKEIANQRQFFDYLGEKIGIIQLDDWYTKISNNLIRQHGGRGLLNAYNQSPTTALMAAYPEHNWIPWKFNQVSDGFWNTKDNTSKFLAELSEKLSIQTLDDWYRVDYPQLHRFGAATLVTKYKGLYGLLKEHYPHHSWDPKRFKQTGRKAQRWLAVTLKKMFPNEEIMEDYMHPKVMLPSSNRPLQLDVFIPSKSLAFEYQGIQHFQEVGVFNPSATYQRRDEEKRVLCASNNIKLIEVPYWWNRTPESLQEMMEKPPVTVSVGQQ